MARGVGGRGGVVEEEGVWVIHGIVRTDANDGTNWCPTVFSRVRHIESVNTVINIVTEITGTQLIHFDHKCVQLCTTKYQNQKKASHFFLTLPSPLFHVQP